MMTSANTRRAFRPLGRVFAVLGPALKLRSAVILAMTTMAVVPAEATLVYLDNAKITKVEAWGGLFTVYLNRTHGATACGHNASFAIDGTTDAGKLMASTLLTAWTANKTLHAYILDDTCLGDRPTVRNFFVE